MRYQGNTSLEALLVTLNKLENKWAYLYCFLLTAELERRLF